MTTRDRDDEFPPSIQHVPLLPADAQRMGLDRNTEEGALIRFAGSLNPSRLSHRIVAWVLLAAFVFPVAYTVLSEIF